LIEDFLTQFNLYLYKNDLQKLSGLYIKDHRPKFDDIKIGGIKRVPKTLEVIEER